MQDRPLHRIIRKLANRALPFMGLFLATWLLTGCRYFYNRQADFRDMIQIGAGVTATNDASGPVVPALGVNAHLTDLIGNLGCSYYYGHSAEWDGRGFFAGPEERLVAGIPFIVQAERIRQDYVSGNENYFKKDNLWNARMGTDKYCLWLDTPAKDLRYEDYSSSETKIKTLKFPWWVFVLDTGESYSSYESREVEFGLAGGLFHRGWNHWENMALELSLGDPLITKLGFNLRFGLDLSEAADFVFGIVGLDLYGDDLRPEEFLEFEGKSPAPEEPVEGAS